MRYFEVVVPENVTLTIEKRPEGVYVKAKGPKGEAERLFKDPTLEVKVENGKVEVESQQEAMVNTVKRHIQNLIKGVTEGFTRKMVVRYAHFPIKVEVKGKEVIIKNFLGERAPRIAKIHGNAKVTVKGQELIIEGTDIEHVTQTVANIRQATKIRGKDTRVFQDGIYPALE